MATVSTTYFYNEVLVGLVNGVNTVFTSQYQLGVIEDMRVGNVSYSDFTFTPGSMTVTLTDAPTIATGAPHIDYFVYEAVPTPVGTAVTFADVRASTYRLLGHDESSEQFQVELVEEKLNEASRVLNNVRANPRLKLGSFSFNPTGVLTASAYSATEINVGIVPTNTPSAGYLVFGGCSPIAYSGTSASAFTGLTGLDYTYEAGTVANVGYLLPTALKKVSAVYVDGYRLDYVDFRLFTNNAKSYPDTAAKFTIWRDQTTGDDYLFLPPNTEVDNIVTVHYVPLNQQYDDDADLVDFEEDYRQLLSLYAAYKCLLYREDDRWQTFKAEYEEEFKKYKAYIRRVEATQSAIVSTALRGF